MIDCKHTDFHKERVTEYDEEDCCATYILTCNGCGMQVPVRLFLGIEDEQSASIWNDVRKG